jgi:hypothetical protein
LICLGVGMAWVDDLPAALLHPSAVAIVRWTILGLALGPLFYYLVGIYSAWRFFRVAHRGAGQTPPANNDVRPISVLKPIRGLDPVHMKTSRAFAARIIRNLRFCLP